jgi:hypothetical protein
MKIFQKDFLAEYFIIAVLALGSTPAFSQVSISIDIAPPPLQVYDQPACPDDGYIWTPGYWAYGDNAYYWVPGAWVQPPQMGDFWTPPYWGWDGNAYVFNAGYWGPNVGYYGGINYGYGYGGHGYGGGRWQGGHFSYNTAVNNVSSTNIHNTYVDRTAINNNASKVSYNGGKGGVQAQPTAQERTTHPTSVQQPEATVHPQAPIQQKAEPQQEPAQAQQPEHQQQQPKPNNQQQAAAPTQAPEKSSCNRATGPAKAMSNKPKQESHHQQPQQPTSDKSPLHSPIRNLTTSPITLQSLKPCRYFLMVTRPTPLPT